jgi:hypothetical protein
VAESIEIGIVPIFVRTLRGSRAFHRCQHGLRLRVNVPLGSRKIAVAGEISECVKGPCAPPARKARVSKV